jgi:superfamily II DNA or RNA helicase
MDSTRHPLRDEQARSTHHGDEMTDDHSLTRLDLRDYQDEAITYALDRDRATVCLPTGTGKTLVGCAWACEVLSAPGVDRVLVVEPSRFLVEQTAAYYRKHTTIPTETLYGTTQRADRVERWAEGTAVVTTPQTALNDVAHLDFDAVVVDECHHTTGQHAFAELMRTAAFDRTLGLSATVPPHTESTVANLVGPVRRWSYADLPDDHVPDWLGEVYDAPYPTDYRSITEELDEFRLELDGTPLAGLPSLGRRMLARDGALALEETLRRDTAMAEVMGDRLLPMIDDAPDLHKLAACRDALATHEFEKAVLFVDRVCVAERLADELADYDPVVLLGRLHSGTAAQEQVVENAKSTETDLVIATSAGEEGVDLPAADLLVVWSNVVSAVRFVQRLGRIMRQTEDRRLKHAVYLATPDSPDYDALGRGVRAASEAGLDITGIDGDVIVAEGLLGRVIDAVDANPSRSDEVVTVLNKPDSAVERLLGEGVREGHLCYVYAVPDDLNEWRSAASGWASAFGADTDPSNLADGVANNFSPTAADRYYARQDDLPLLRTEYPGLFATDGARLDVSFDSSDDDQWAHEARGDPETVADEMCATLADVEQFYANISVGSRQPTYSIKLSYHGSATRPVVDAVCANAAAVATEVRTRVDD